MAKDVITRFKLETTQYDSKMKQAAKGLSDFSKTATQAKEGFSQFTKANVDAAKALGTMATSSTNAKDKTKELVGAFNEAAKAYNQLTKEQQQSDWAKALAGSLTQLQQRIKDTKQEMQGLGDSMKGSGLFGGGKLDGMLQVFGGNLMTKGAGMIAGFASEMGDMVKQGIELAKQGEGVRIAFERLGRGDILNGLREATHGTVTDLELMKAAVKFNDFKLPVEELGTMLAFAQQKAKDTGQSVDYMVDSIVTGLGRKSLMILDNLGLSAAEIKDRMKETGDMTKAVGAIIREQMSKAGDYVETAADRAAQANVNMQNKMEELGRKFAPLQEASNSLWTSMKIGILDVIGGPLTDLLNKLTEAGRLRNALNNINGDGTKGNTQVGNQLKQLQAAKKSGASQYMLNSMQSGVVEGYQRQISEREQAIKDWKSWRSGNRSEGLQQRIGQWRDKYGTDVNSIKAEADAYRSMIAEYRKGAKDIMTPVKVNVDTSGAVKSLSEMKTQLAELQAQRKKVAAGSDEAKQLDTQIRNLKADIKLQDPTSLKTTTTKLDEIQKIQKKINDLTNESYTADSKRVEEIRVQIAALQEEERRLTAIKDLVTGKNYDPLKALEMTTGLSGFNEQTISAWTSMIKSQLAKEDIGSDMYNSLTQNLADMSTLTTAVQDAMKLGLQIPQDAVQEMFEAVFDQGNLPEDLYAGMIQKFIDDFKERTGQDLEVGENGSLTVGKGKGKEEKKDEKQNKSVAEGFGQLTGGIQQMVGSMQQLGIEIPAGLSNVLGGIQSVVTILTTISTIVSAIEAISAADTFIPFARGGIVRAAGGFSVPGNNYSGDRVPALLNSGELVLNKAQQGNLASQLEGSGLGNIRLEAVASGEQLFFVQNNRGLRTGRGEIVQSKRRR